MLQAFICCRKSYYIVSLYQYQHYRYCVFYCSQVHGCLLLLQNGRLNSFRGCGLDCANDPFKVGTILAPRLGFGSLLFRIRRRQNSHQIVS